MATDYAKLYDEQMLENKNKQIAVINEASAKNKQTITDNYTAKINEAETSYDDQYRVNAVQKLINERQVAESMANSGLTNSGLNRTQQTAVQLSYANNKAKLDRQRQSVLDNLNREMAAYISDAETKAASDVASIENAYTQNRQNYISTMEQAEIDAETQRLKDELENQRKLSEATIKAKAQQNAKISRINYGKLATMSYSSNGNVVYTDVNGNSVTMREGANPYTGKVNSELLVDGEYDASRAFSNGYQPRYYKNKELTAYKPPKTSSISSKTTVPWRDDGVEQQVFTTGGNKYYVWYGKENRYVEARYNPIRETWEFNLG